MNEDPISICQENVQLFSNILNNLLNQRRRGRPSNKLKHRLNALENLIKLSKEEIDLLRSREGSDIVSAVLIN